MQRALSYRVNRDLFSNHYLDEHLPETAAWEAVGEAELREAREDILELWEREQDTAPQRNESQLEEKFIRPMFRKLGIPFEVEDDLRRYVETKERADELDEQIDKTDELIDEIVYELYGLTDEEIELVEEAVGG